MGGRDGRSMTIRLGPEAAAVADAMPRGTMATTVESLLIAHKQGRVVPAELIPPGVEPWAYILDALSAARVGK